MTRAGTEDAAAVPPETGEVRRFSGESRLCRVLAADAFEVLYDIWWDHLNGGRGGWGIHSPRGTQHYSRVPTPLMRARSEWTDTAPLSAEEHAVHRPDLPLRLLRGLSWRWSRTPSLDPEGFADTVAAAGLDVEALRSQVLLAAPAIAASPLGPRGTPRPAVILRAPDGEAFNGLDLLRALHDVQAAHDTPAADGVGLYRLGIAKGLPAFYIGGARDLAGFLPAA